MAQTNFAALTAEQLTAWQRSVWVEARNKSFINQFASSGINSMVQRVTELKKSEKGARAVMTLVNEMETDGVMGDYEAEGNEEGLSSTEDVIRIDQIRNANRSKGRLAEQKSVVNFREQSKDKLGYWLADRCDQMAFLTLSGIAYTKTNKGATRPVRKTGLNLGDLEFAADVTAPTARRHLRWDATTGLEQGDTSAVVAADTLTYAAIVRLLAYAEDEYIRPIMSKGNSSMYHIFVSPQGLADLKLDQDFLDNVRHALPRSKDNQLFSGTTQTVMIDGAYIHSFRHVYNTLGATSGTDKWGSSSDVDGQRVLLCGAQALGLADISAPTWVEKDFDYGNKQGISVGKILGLKKPKFKSSHSGTTEDFSVICLDTAVSAAI